MGPGPTTGPGGPGGRTTRTTRSAGLLSSPESSTTVNRKSHGPAGSLFSTSNVGLLELMATPWVRIGIDQPRSTSVKRYSTTLPGATSDERAPDKMND